MGDINKIAVTTKEQIKDLYDHSAFTVEGFAEQSIPDLVEWVESRTPLKKKDVYVTKGAMMNETYGLTGDNRYQDDCTIVSIKLDDMEDFEKIVIPRFNIGGRWFDDIVDNNLRREAEKGNPLSDRDDDFGERDE